MTKYAVCMGVDNYSLWNTATNLPYAASSASEFAQMLVDAFGFESDNVLIMRDNWCTRGNIISAINRTLNKAVAGDVVCVYFAGHGTRVQGTAPNGQPEQDRWYEAFLPYSGQVITDRDLANLADQIEYDHVNFTIVLDTCHSGGMHAIEGAPQPVGVELPAVLTPVFQEACRSLVPMGLCLEHPRSELAGNVRQIRVENGRLIIEAVDDAHFVARAKSTLLSACAADEFGWHVGAIQSTILLGAFKNVVNQSNFERSYADLLGELRVTANKLMTKHVRPIKKYADESSVPQLYGQRARMEEGFLVPWNASVVG